MKITKVVFHVVDGSGFSEPAIFCVDWTVEKQPDSSVSVLVRTSDTGAFVSEEVVTCTVEKPERKLAASISALLQLFGLLA